MKTKYSSAKDYPYLLDIATITKNSTTAAAAITTTAAGKYNYFGYYTASNYFQSTYPDMTSECVLTEALADLLLLFVVEGAFCLHDALDDDVPGQEAHFRSLVHVVCEVAIVTVQKRP